MIPHLAEMIPPLPEMIPHLAGMIPPLAGMIPHLAGMIPHLAGMIPPLAGMIPHLAGMIPHLGDARHSPRLPHFYSNFTEHPRRSFPRQCIRAPLLSASANRKTNMPTPYANNSLRVCGSVGFQAASRI
jgi:hypothetical protein